MHCEVIVNTSCFPFLIIHTRLLMTVGVWDVIMTIFLQNHILYGVDIQQLFMLYIYGARTFGGKLVFALLHVLCAILHSDNIIESATGHSDIRCAVTIC